MPSDWGTTIVDAGGSFHDLAKNAFDSFSTNASQPLNITENLLRDTFKDTWQSFREKASAEFGIPMDEGLSLENIGKKLATGVATTALELGLEAGGGYLLAKAAQVEGPIGILLSEVVTIGIAQFSKAWIKETYEAGQWVILDLGMIPIRINQAPHVIQVSEAKSLWGDSYIDLPDDVDYEEQPHHVVGFIMGPSTLTEWVCFNFEEGRERIYDQEKIRAAPPELAAKLDKEEQFSLVREVKFLKDHDPTLQSYVPTQPGDGVEYKGEGYVIIDTFDDEYLIENLFTGARKHVNVTQLTGGKRTSTSAWKRGNLVDSTFTSLSPDSIFSGQWVWIPAGRKFITDMLDLGKRRRMAVVPDVKADSDILALVEYVEGDQVHLVRAFDGKEMVEPIDLTRGVKGELAGTLNHNKDAKRFKMDILEGKDPEKHPLGETLPDVSLGVGPPDLTKSDDMKPFMKVQKNRPADRGVVNFPGDRNALTSMAREYQAEVDDAERYDATAKLEVKFERIAKKPETTSSNVMFLIAGVVIFVALYGK
jgi:hypothetical protein